MEIKATHATVTGRVQGVGFRYATHRIALDLELKGWVRNLSDGSVEVRAQGSSTAVEELLAFLRDGPFGAQIQSMDATELENDPSLTRFEIRV